MDAQDVVGEQGEEEAKVHYCSTFDIEAMSSSGANFAFESFLAQKPYVG